MKELENLLKAWKAFPGRSCDDHDWNHWIDGMIAAARDAEQKIRRYKRLGLKIAEQPKDEHDDDE